MDIEFTPIAAAHADGFHRALDTVAHERKYLALLEAPPLAGTRQFVLDNIAKGHPQIVAVADGNVVGWCDVLPKGAPVHAHVGILGMGLLPEFRGQGYGTKLIHIALREARRFGFIRIELAVHADNESAIRLYDKFGFMTEDVMRDAVLID